MSDGPLLFGDVEFREATDYAVVDAGTYTIDVRPAGEDTVALRMELSLEAGTIYDAIALGRAGDRSLTLLVLTSPAGVREGEVATSGAAVETTPETAATVAPAATAVAEATAAATAPP